MRFEVKQWIYVDVQTKAQKYNFTLCWELAHDEDPFGDCWDEKDTFYLWGNVVRETEKATLFELDYWNLNRCGRYATDAPRCNGFKVWIPKSAIL